MSLQSTAVQVAQPASLPRLLTLSLANCSFPKMFRMAEFFGGCRYGFLHLRADSKSLMIVLRAITRHLKLASLPAIASHVFFIHAAHLTISQELD